MSSDQRRRDPETRLTSALDGPRVRTNDPSGGRVTESEFYDVVGNARRRASVEYLLGEGEQTSISELVSYVVDREDAPGDDSHRKSVYSSLRQTHLPKLEEYGIVEYNAESNTVSPARNLDAFEKAERSTPSIPRTLPWVFVALGLLAIGWFALGIFGVIDLSPRRFLLVSLGYMLLVFLEGLWEVQHLRSALDQRADGR